MGYDLVCQDAAVAALSFCNYQSCSWPTTAKEEPEEPSCPTVGFMQVHRTGFTLGSFPGSPTDASVGLQR